MNTIFISVYDNKSEKKTKYNLLKSKFYIKSDILNNKNFCNNVSLCFDINFINELKDNLKNKMTFATTYVLKLQLSLILKKYHNKVYVLYSNYFDLEKNKEIKEKLNEILLSCNKNNIDIVEILNKNEMTINDEKYITQWENKKVKNINKLKVLFIPQAYSVNLENKMFEYVKKFKFIDILKSEFLSKENVTRISKVINKCNNEYGTDISFVTNKNLVEYDAIFYNFENEVDITEKIYQKFILKKNVLKLDYMNVYNDIFNTQILMYNRYRLEIITLFNRLDIDVKDFSHNKLGCMFNKSLTCNV